RRRFSCLPFPWKSDRQIAAGVVRRSRRARSTRVTEASGPRPPVFDQRQFRAKRFFILMWLSLVFHGESGIGKIELAFTVSCRFRIPSGQARPCRAAKVSSPSASGCAGLVFHAITKLPQKHVLALGAQEPCEAYLAAPALREQSPGRIAAVACGQVNHGHVRRRDVEFYALDSMPREVIEKDFRDEAPYPLAPLVLGKSRRGADVVRAPVERCANQNPNRLFAVEKLEGVAGDRVVPSLRSIDAGSL